MPDPTAILSLLLAALGRLCLGGYFVAAGLRRLALRDRIAPVLAERGWPAPGAMVTLLAAAEVGAGALLATGLLVTLPALVLVAVTLAVAVLLLDFWALPPGPDREIAQAFFALHAGLLGGLLLVLA